MVYEGIKHSSHAVDDENRLREMKPVPLPEQLSSQVGSKKGSYQINSTKPYN